MPIIEMVLPGEPKQQPEHVAEVYRITVERGMALHVPIWRPKQR